MVGRWVGGTLVLPPRTDQAFNGSTEWREVGVDEQLVSQEHRYRRHGRVQRAQLSSEQ